MTMGKRDSKEPIRKVKHMENGFVGTKMETKKKKVLQTNGKKMGSSLNGMLMVTS